MDKIIEVYQKYEHLDKLLSDKDWLPKTIQGKVIYDLWGAIKYTVEEKGDVGK